MGIEEKDTEMRRNGKADKSPEDSRYYVHCPKRKDQGKVPVVKCFDCEFSTGSAEGERVDISCGFPVGRIMKKPWRRKGSRYPRVNKIARDGLS